ncbi:MAG: LysM domain-containing protein [Chloroflexota bacterium]
MRSTGGELADQVRAWIDTVRARLGLGGEAAQGDSARPAGRRPLGHAQAVPLGGRDGLDGATVRHSAYASERADRGAYTLVFAGVLIALVVLLFVVLSWLTGYPGGSNQATPTPAPVAEPQPKPPVLLPSPVVALPSPSPSPAPTVTRVHVVEAGDTLNKIATRYGVTVEAIMQANNIADRNRIIRIGERFNIPEPPPGAPPGPGAPGVPTPGPR